MITKKMRRSIKGYYKKVGIIALSGVVLGVLGWNSLGSIMLGQAASRTALLSGFVDNQQENGAYTLRVIANDSPVNATFFLTNTQSNERSSVVADCAIDPESQEAQGTCVKVIGTLPMTSGLYVISARAAYADGVAVTSNQISVQMPVSRVEEPPIVIPEEPEPISIEPTVKPKPIQPKPTPVTKPLSLFGQILATIRSQSNTPQQQSALAAPILLELNDIGRGLRGGERDSADAKIRLSALQADLWEGIDMASSTAQAGIRYQSAKEFGTIVDARVMEVNAVSIATTSKDVIVTTTTTGTQGEQVIINKREKAIIEKVTVTGHTLPNMYATVYIYGASATIGTVAADTKGAWTYELTKTLPDGSYEIYVAAIERTGKVIAKSKPFSFTKKGEVITIDQGDAGAGNSSSTEPVEPTKPVGMSTQAIIVFVIAGIGLLIGTGLIIWQIMKYRQNSL